MNVWHLTPETPREPSRVTPGSPLHLRIGTWPIEPGQEVTVEFSVTSWSGRMADGQAQACWLENRGENSYWASLTVRPAIHLALLWHHHQPLYRDLTAPPDGAYRFPWVRLHGLRDYFGMAYLLAQYPDVHATINVSPVLLWQLEDYLERGGSDRALRLTRTRTSALTAAERRELLETFFDAHWHHQIYPYPRYRALRLSGRRSKRALPALPGPESRVGGGIEPRVPEPTALRHHRFSLPGHAGPAAGGTGLPRCSQGAGGRAARRARLSGRGDPRRRKRLGELSGRRSSLPVRPLWSAGGRCRDQNGDRFRVPGGACRPSPAAARRRRAAAGV